MFIEVLFRIVKHGSHPNVYWQMNGWRRYGICTNGILLSHKTEWNNAIIGKMDGPRDYHTNWSQAKKEKYHIILSLCGLAKSQTWLSDFNFPFHFHALEKEMATHSSVLAWRIPGTGEPDGLPSMGSHRVGYDWSSLAAAAAYPSSGLREFMGEEEYSSLT